jgi:hypothetical protein
VDFAGGIAEDVLNRIADGASAKLLPDGAGEQDGVGSFFNCLIDDGGASRPGLEELGGDVIALSADAARCDSTGFVEDLFAAYNFGGKFGIEGDRLLNFDDIGEGDVRVGLARYLADDFHEAGIFLAARDIDKKSKWRRVGKSG